MGLKYELAVQEDLRVGTLDGVDVTNPDGGVLSGTEIGLHTVATGQRARSKVWNPASISAASYEATSITVPGAVVGDFVMASLDTMVTNDMQLTAHVSANDTVRCVLYNATASPVNLASGTLQAIVFKARSAA